MSSNNGAGVTHLAISMANYIKNNNESVCYVEANESGDLNAMAEFYGLELVEDNHYQRDGVDYWHQLIDPEKKFAVLDLGKYSSTKLNLFNQCKIKILVTDGKPYRMADALNVLRYIGDDNTRFWLNFNKEKDFEEIRTRYLAGIQNPVGGIAWHDDMFQGNDILYREILEGYIYVPQKRSKLAIVLNADKLKGIMKPKKRVTVSPVQEEVSVNDGDIFDLPEETIQEETEVVAVMDEAESDELEETDFFENVDMDEIDASEIHTEEIIIEEEQIEETLIEPKATEEEYVEYMDEESEGNNEVDAEPVIEKTRKKGVAVNSNLLLFLIGGISALGLITVFNQSADWPEFFSFKDQVTEQRVTELIDSNLNINPDIKISVLEVEGADGYEVSYSTDREFPDERTIIVEVETADKAVESLTAGKTYYVRVRAFKFNEDGTKVYGDYTEVQEIET